MNPIVWPTISHYQDAFRHHHLHIKDQHLLSVAPRCGPDGSPLPDSGGSGVIFRLDSADPAPRSWAVKCFLRDSPDRTARYRALIDWLAEWGDPWQANCRVLEEGIRIDGHWWPVLVMDWIAGVPLMRWVEGQMSALGPPDSPSPGTPDNASAGTPDNASATSRQVADRMAAVAQDFALMVNVMHTRLISHGDIQHGNTFVGADCRVRFIDYDNMTVPGEFSRWSDGAGHPNYRHPGPPDARATNIDRDRFPAHVLHHALRALARDPRLWQRLHVPDDGDFLLLNADDFAAPADSERWRLLLDHPDQEIAGSTESLLAMLREPLSGVPALQPRSAVRGLPAWMTGIAHRTLPAADDPAAIPAATAAADTAPEPDSPPTPAYTPTPAPRSVPATHTPAPPAPPATPTPAYTPTPVPAPPARTPAPPPPRPEAVPDAGAAAGSVPRPVPDPVPPPKPVPAASPYASSRPSHDPDAGPEPDEPDEPANPYAVPLPLPLSASIRYQPPARNRYLAVAAWSGLALLVVVLAVLLALLVG